MSATENDQTYSQAEKTTDDKQIYKKRKKHIHFSITVQKKNLYHISINIHKNYNTILSMRT